MLGGEFLTHQSQQKAMMKVADPKFPGMAGLGEGFEMKEEWYAFCKFAPDLHVILVQETGGMHDPAYQRPPYPATWARMQQKGRVFYTSMGHREDVLDQSQVPAGAAGRHQLGAEERRGRRDAEHRPGHAGGE